VVVARVPDSGELPTPSRVASKGSILELLAGHESFGYEQIAAQLGARPEDVRSALADLRDTGFVDVLRVGDLQRQTTKAASYWALTHAGRRELARRRSQEPKS
jgi:predicted ArsR family transcriptional regulator